MNSFDYRTNCLLLNYKHFTSDPVYKIKVNLIDKRKYGQYNNNNNNNNNNDPVINKAKD